MRIRGFLRECGVELAVDDEADSGLLARACLADFDEELLKASPSYRIAHHSRGSGAVVRHL